MKKKIIGVLLSCIIILSLTIISLNNQVETKKEIRYNITHKKEDINKVMDMAIQDYKNMKTNVYSVYYDENMTYEEEQRYLKKTENSQEVIIVYLNFKTGFFDVSPGFGANQEYIDYSYVACKTRSGNWIFIDGGYG